LLRAAASRSYQVPEWVQLVVEMSGRVGFVASCFPYVLKMVSNALITFLSSNDRASITFTWAKPQRPAENQ
jgi:hypothetical protein